MLESTLQRFEGDFEMLLRKLKHSVISDEGIGNIWQIY
jgi:hypothetical protein